MIQLNVRPQAGFDDPLALLQDCHRRIERFLELLIKVNQQTAGGELNPEQRRALHTALDYFSHAAPNHTRDEEESLFPRLRAAGTPDVERTLAKVAELEKDHDVADAAHARVDTIGRAWLSEGTIGEKSSQELGVMLATLRADYQRHIAVEDNDLFPLAGQVLGREDLLQMGREMANRRGVAHGTAARS